MKMGAVVASVLFGSTLAPIASKADDEQAGCKACEMDALTVCAKIHSGSRAHYKLPQSQQRANLRTLPAWRLHTDEYDRVLNTMRRVGASARLRLTPTAGPINGKQFPAAHTPFGPAQRNGA